MPAVIQAINTGRFVKLDKDNMPDLSFHEATVFVSRDAAERFRSGMRELYTDPENHFAILGED